MKFIRVFVITGLAQLLGACGSESSTSSGGGNSSASAATKIVALGDSIGARYPNWPTIVSQATWNFMGRVENILDSEQPSHLLILLGTNDSRGGLVGTACSNLQAKADHANARGIYVVIGTIPPNLQDASADARNAAISDCIRSIQGARIAEVRGALGSGHGMFPDGLHPNETGSTIIADAFLDHM
jgi:hypothetical protein